MLHQIVCQTCFDLVRSVRRAGDVSSIEEPKMCCCWLVSFHNLSNSCVRWRLGGFEREFLQQKFSVDGDDDGLSSFHMLDHNESREEG